MGYYTSFDLDNNATGEVLGQIESHIMNLYQENGSYYGIMWCFDEELDSFDHGEPCKWYSHEIEMIKLSSVFPEVLFTLKGEGEDAGDIWIKYFKGGKLQISKAIISFEDFDETKLK